MLFPNSQKKSQFFLNFWAIPNAAKAASGRAIHYSKSSLFINIKDCFCFHSYPYSKIPVQTFMN